MIHLHIGRHKTGTSALQHFLKANRAALAQRGFDYPHPLDGAPAHHGLARALPQAGAPPQWQPSPGDMSEVERFAALGRTTDHLIVSSERLQSADPKAVRALWPDQPAEVIVYLREPLAYMLSSYAQAVHARAFRTPLVEYAARFRPDYPGFVRRWAEAFGEEAIRFRLYERGRLQDGDVRRDFLRVLGLEADGFDFNQTETNPSLGPELIEFKGLVNAALTPERQSKLKLYVLLSRLTSRFPDRLRVTPAFADAFRQPFRARNAEMLRLYTAGAVDAFEERVIEEAILPVDRSEARARVLEALREMAPNVGRVLSRELPHDHADVAPLLPLDWDAAVGAFQASTSGGGA